MGGSQNKMAEEDNTLKEDILEEPFPAFPPFDGSFRSQVQFAYQPGGPFPSHCGYCHSQNEQFKIEGVWSEHMSTRDFQTLVDSGFQRSGRFVYLPANELTCCPQYVLRLDTKTFRTSKQQRRVIRKMNEYLINGLPTSVEGEGGGEEEEGGEEEGEVKEKTTTSSGAHDMEGVTQLEGVAQSEGVAQLEGVALEKGAIVQLEGVAQSEGAVVQPEGVALEEGGASVTTTTCMSKSSPKRKKEVKPGKGPDPNLPPCKKAKERRKEKKKNKPSTSATPITVTMETNEREGTNMAELLSLPSSTSYKHKLKIKLLCVSPMDDTEFMDTYEESYEVFRKFQTVIHKEPPEKCEREQFDQFCIESPLKQEEGPPGTNIKYGSYHQQYWIDDNLVMVGVLDIIPQGVLCNYLYYDPFYRFIAPGVYSAMYEISMTQQLFRQDPNIRYYYMGYYVHDCPKMNYKRRYDSSYLLCPVTLKYEPLEACRLKLDSAPVCKFSDEATPPVNRTGEGRIEEVLIDANNEEGYIKYSMVQTMIGSNKMDHMISSYIGTVGEKLAHTMTLKIPGLQF